MNPHIELVKKWLDDPKSVSAEELKRADVAAAAAAELEVGAYAYAAAYAAAAAYDGAYAYDAAETVANAATVTAYADSKANKVKYWVERYEELTQ